MTTRAYRVSLVVAALGVLLFGGWLAITLWNWITEGTGGMSVFSWLVVVGLMLVGLLMSVLYGLAVHTLHTKVSQLMKLTIAAAELAASRRTADEEAARTTEVFSTPSEVLNALITRRITGTTQVGCAYCPWLGDARLFPSHLLACPDQTRTT